MVREQIEIIDDRAGKRNSSTFMVLDSMRFVRCGMKLRNSPSSPQHYYALHTAARV